MSVRIRILALTILSISLASALTIVFLDQPTSEASGVDGSYTITYDCGEYGGVMTQAVSSGEDVKLLDGSDFHRDGYELMGWMMYGSESVRFAPNDIIPNYGYGNLKLIPIWEKRSYEVLITTVGNGSLSTQTLTLDKDTSWTVDGNVLEFEGGRTVIAYPDDGYALDSWFPASGTVQIDTVIVAYFTKITSSHFVTIEVNNSNLGTVTQSLIRVSDGTSWMVYENSLIFSDGQIVRAETPFDYVSFEGWSPRIGAVTSDVTITANFIELDHPVTEPPVSDNHEEDSPITMMIASAVLLIVIVIIIIIVVKHRNP